MLPDMKTTPNLVRCFILALILGATTALGFPRDEFNPFPPNARPEQIAVHEIPRTIERNQEGEFERLVFQGSVDGHEITMWMSEEESDLVVDGESKYADKSGGCGGSPFFSLYAGDLNQDDILDFLLNHWQGGNGWAAGGATLTFILSAGDAYNTSSLLAHYPWEENFVMLEGKPCFIHTSTGILGDAELQAREYYYVHSIMVIDGATLRVDNSLYPGFPMIQSAYVMSDREGLSEESRTVLDGMTEEQKEELRRKALREICQ